MRFLIISLFTVINTLTLAAGGSAEDGWFPKTPNERLTPGALCFHADSFRYPERIAYCERAVSKEKKAEVFRAYDQELGFHTLDMNRSDFKIDHYIPLCMGGSNSEENLWPQHKTVYAQTDPIEAPLCELMASGKMLQSKAIEIIRHVKRNPNEVPKYLRDLRSQLN